MAASRAKAKSTQDNHRFPLSMLKDLPRLLESPMAIFAYGERAKAQNIIVGVEHNGKNLLVGLHLNQQRRAIEVNDIRGLFPKDTYEWLGWIEQGKALYLDKKSIQEKMSQQRINLAEVAHLNLDAITKIVEEFENPKISSEESAVDTDTSEKNSYRSMEDRGQADESITSPDQTLMDHAHTLARELGAEVVVVSRDEITNRDPRTEARMRKSKGWYDPKSGKVTIVRENATNMADVSATIFHEIVGHKGLRGVYGAAFDSMLRGVYKRLPQSVREEIASRAVRNGWDLMEATEEYIAELAEGGVTDADKGGAWQAVKRAVIDMLDKLGVHLGFTLSDADMRYLLWRSYHAQRNAGALAEAEDIVAQRKLGVRSFAKHGAMPAPIVMRDGIDDELESIKKRTIADGSFMKAPNGDPSNLNERQWLQVRTKAFKKWFGDWEKAARIEKLRKAEPIEISGTEHKGKYELNRDSAKSWIKDNLRGEYTNKDTNDVIFLAKDGAQKVTSHSMGNQAHLKSIAAIPRLIEGAIFIDERPNEKNNGKYDSYRYYVAGLKIDGIDYTAKLTIGVDANGRKFYDHSLTEIEKGRLIDEVGALSPTLPSNNKSVLSTTKDTKLISLLQVGEVSKVVDENGEPLVVYHGTRTGGFSTFDNTEGDRRSDTPDGANFFTNKLSVAYTYSGSYDDPTYERDEYDEETYKSIYGVFLNIREPEEAYFEGADWTGMAMGKAELFDSEDISVDTPNGSRFFDSYAEAETYAEELGLDGYYIQEDPFVGYNTNEFFEESQRYGADGAIIYNVVDTGSYGGEEESTVYIVPNSSQIKSATDNVGTFDEASDDIRFRGGDVDLDRADSEGGSEGMAKQLYERSVKTNSFFTAYKWREGRQETGNRLHSHDITKIELLAPRRGIAQYRR